MSIDRERERREGEAGEIERKIESKFRKKQGERGGFNPEEGRKDGDFEREREKSNARKIKISSI